MKQNKFYKIVNKFIHDNSLEKYNPTHRLYKEMSSYVLLMLGIEDTYDLVFGPDMSYQLIEHHMTVFEDLEQHGDSSTFHYTAKLTSADGYFVYRLRVFFNDHDQPMGISWYRKATEQSDVLYIPIELTAREIKLTMDFAADQLKSLIGLIRAEQTLQVKKAQENYEKLHQAYVQLIDEQAEGTPFAIEQAQYYLSEMKTSLLLQDELGVQSARNKLAHIAKVETLINGIQEPENVSESSLTPNASIVESKSSELGAVQPLKVFNVSKPKIETSILEEKLATLTAKYAAIPDAFKVNPENGKKVLHEAYLDFIKSLQKDYHECCQQYFLFSEDRASIGQLKHFKTLNQMMDWIALEHARVETKHVQTLLLCGDQTPDIIEHLRACSSAIEQLVLNFVKFVMRNNKSSFLQIILDYKKLSTVEIVEIFRAIFTQEISTECFSDFLNRYRIHSYLLEKDKDGVLLATHLFALPLTHSIRLTCVYETPALSARTFYSKLQAELQRDKILNPHDEFFIDTYIENAQMAECLYASSSEQKHQMRQNIKWLRQLPISVQTALDRLSFESNSSCGRKVTLLYQISQEINCTIEILSMHNPEFVERLKEASKSQLGEFKSALLENEEYFVAYLNSIDAVELEQNLDVTIEYSHLMNNYLRYCLPSSTSELTEDSRTILREYYYNELKRFGMKTNPYELIKNALSAISEGMQAIQSVLTEHVRMLQNIANQPNGVSYQDLSALLNNFKQLSSLVGSGLPEIEEDESTNASGVRLIN